MKNKALEALDTIIGRAPENQKEKMRLSVMTVTPKMAEKFLSVNNVNRPVRRRNVQYWKSVIIGDAVPLTHQGIAITGTIGNPKRLIDGQHRCLAIIETGRNVDFVVSENTPEEAYTCVDNGLPRSMADRAGITTEEAQLNTSLYYLSQGGKNLKPPVKLIQEIHQIIKPWSTHVLNKKRRSLSLVAIRLAFLCQQRVYKSNYSEEFQDGHFGVLPESMNALYRRQSTRPLGQGGGSASAALFCATWRAITRPSNSKIYAPVSPLEEAQNIVNSAFPEIKELRMKYDEI